MLVISGFRIMGETHYHSFKKLNKYNCVCLASQLEKNMDIIGEDMIIA